MLGVAIVSGGALLTSQIDESWSYEQLVLLSMFTASASVAPCHR